MRFKKESMACADRIEYVLESLYKDYQMTNEEFKNPKFKNIKGVQVPNRYAILRYQKFMKDQKK